MNTYALISKTLNTVSNILQSDQTLQELSDMFTNFTVVEIADGVRCAVNDYYNPTDGLFYIDPDFTWLSGTTPPPSLEDAYAASLKMLRENGSAALISIKPPYSEQEAATWWAQSEEAKLWINDNSYVPEMLNAIVTSSNGAYTLPSLASEISDNVSSWKEAAGSVIGQIKNKTDQLNAIKADVIAGTKNVMEIVNFNTEIPLQ
ncbi:hypothetical protein BBB57_01340 [Kosakonia sacchari]|uniref:hypothetical protein n=1 Tax=Kosakonia sacchari TaxID=1158459 RepID=UPI00080743B7|nr:hypothetical protein [Kosakonia sacchari]ANR77017.1 hypothetical protein BBB57_01340 [Kosakonia sacchari]